MSQDGEEIAVVNGSEESWSIEGLTPDCVYLFSVTAGDPSGLNSVPPDLTSRHRQHRTCRQMGLESPGTIRGQSELVRGLDEEPWRISSVQTIFSSGKPMLRRRTFRWSTHP